MIYIRAIHFAATLMASGVVVFIVFVAAPALAGAHDDKTLRAELWPKLAFVGWFNLVLAIGSGAAWLVLTASAMSGTPAMDMSREVLWTVLTQTHYGSAAIVRFVAAGVLAMAFALLLSGQDRIWAGAVAVLAAAVLAGAIAFTGHAIGAQGAEGLIHPAADVLHLLAAAAWVGALLPLALLLGAAGKERNSPGTLALARAATLRFSALGVISVGTLLVTGIINTWYLVGSVDALTGTLYGQLLMAKIALFLAMVAIAAVNRQWLTPRLAQNESDARQALARLRRNALVEALAGLAVICIVAEIGTKPPAIHIHRHPAYGAVPADAAFVHIHTEQAMADVTIEPGRTGESHATIRLWNGDFEPLGARALKLSLTPPGGRQAPPLTAAQDAEGAWRIDRVELPRPGNWMVTIEAEIGANSQNSRSHITLAAPIVIDAAQ